MDSSERPIGVSILCVVHILGGVAAGCLLFPLLNADSSGPVQVRILGVPTGVFVGVLLLFSIAGFIGAFGMWMGKTWGWWCVTVYYTYSIMRNALTVFNAWISAHDPDSGFDDLDKYFFRHGGRVIIHALFFLYLFRRNVLDYFDLYALNRPATVLKLFAGVSTALGAFWAIAQVIW